jgi:homocysteine S-methyltransferase
MAPGVARRDSAVVEVRTPLANQPHAQAPVPRADKSVLAGKLAAGRFVTIVEVPPSRGHDATEAIAAACALRDRGVDVVTVPDGPRSGARLSALSLAVLMSQQHGIETLLQYSCRDRNLLGIQSDLLGAHALGLRNLLGITGDARSLGDIPDATAVFDVDSIGLTNVVNRLNHGLDIGGQAIGAPTRFHAGVMANPSRDLDQELKRLDYKIEAGAEFVVTRPIFDVQAFERFLQRVDSFRIPIVVGLWPFDSALNAEFMANEVPGVTVPEALVERMRRTGSAEAAEAEGVAIARELLRDLRSMARGVHVFTQSGRVERAFDVLA